MLSARKVELLAGLKVKGLDLRDLTRDQFDQFGRLVDTSFQVPRELSQMAV